MSVYRVHKTKNYTVMSNEHLMDKDMSLKAKGLLSVMLALPENWDYSINGLCSISRENVGAIKSTLSELRDLGYLVVTKKMPNETQSGRIEYQYDIYETKQGVEKQGVEKQGVENQPVDFQPIENPLQSNTNKSNTNNQDTYISNTERESNKTRTRFIPPTVEEVKAYCIERNNRIDAEHFVDYYTSNGWVVGKVKMKDWKATVRGWEKREPVFAKNNKKEDREYMRNDYSNDPLPF